MATTTEHDDRSVAIVAGGSTGIGASVARRLNEEGYLVVVVSSKSVDEGESVAAELDGGWFLQADLAEPGAAAEVVARVEAEHGRLDTVVYAAGKTARIAHPDIHAVTDDVWDGILKLNVLGPWHVVQAAEPLLRRSPNGNIVVVELVIGLIRATYVTGQTVVIDGGLSLMP